MARVGGPLHSSIASGKISPGLCYDSFRGTAYVRSIPKGGRARSPRQMLIRGRLQALHNAWRALTAPQRAAWGTYAASHPTNDLRFSRTIRITGLNAFLALNSRRLMNALSIVATAPTILPPVSPENARYTFHTFPIRAVVLRWDAPVDIDIFIEIWLHLHPSPVLHPDRRAYAWQKAGRSNLINIPWSNPATGTWYFHTRCQNVDDGQVSQFVANQVTVTPP